MTKFVIEGIEYETPKTLEDINIGKFVKFLTKIMQHIPEELEQVYKTDPEKNQTIMGNWEALEKVGKLKCYDYFAKVVSFWSGALEYDLRNYLSLEELILAFWDIEITLSKIEPDKNFTGFEIDGIEYLMPSKFMSENTFIEFAESAQFEAELNDLKGGSYISILNIMAVLCRPFGEVYDDKNNKERKKLFSTLSMGIAINVAFFFRKLRSILNDNLLIYTLREYKKIQDQKM